MADNTTTEQRIADLRAEAVRLNEDVTALSDIELLLQELDRSNAESRQHQNSYSNLLQDQTKRDRSTRAAARRAAVEERTAWAGMYLQHMIMRSARTINELIHRAADLPDGRVPVELTRDLKEAAARAKWTMSGLVGHREIQVEKTRSQSDEIRLVEKQRDEIWRLREFITAQGRRLHAEHGHPSGREVGWRCECPGCGLIRSMDDVQAEGVDAA